MNRRQCREIFFITEGSFRNRLDQLFRSWRKCKHVDLKSKEYLKFCTAY